MDRFYTEHKLVTSMSIRGNCYDNAAVESLFSSLKKEKYGDIYLKLVKRLKQKCSIILKFSIIGLDFINT